jgi:hypothetical protein
MNVTILALAHAYAQCLVEMHQAEAAWQACLDRQSIKQYDQAIYNLDEAHMALDAACKHAANAK